MELPAFSIEGIVCHCACHLFCHHHPPACHQCATNISGELPMLHQSTEYWILLQYKTTRVKGAPMCYCWASKSGIKLAHKLNGQNQRLPNAFKIIQNSSHKCFWPSLALVELVPPPPLKLSALLPLLPLYFKDGFLDWIAFIIFLQTPPTSLGGWHGGLFIFFLFLISPLRLDGGLAMQGWG